MSPEFATVDFCGELHQIDVGQSLTFGRAADLVIDDNQFLHRQVRQLAHRSGLWWLDNIGTRIPLGVLLVNGVVHGPIGGSRGLLTIEVPSGPTRVTIRSENCIEWDSTVTVTPQLLTTIGYRQPRCQ